MTRTLCKSRLQIGCFKCDAVSKDDRDKKATGACEE